MSLIDRFTRDAASKYIWAALALAAAIGLVFAVSTGGRAQEDERAVSEDRAVGYVEEVLDPRFDDRELATPISGQSADSLEAIVRRSILADERVSRVRIWSTEGTLLFSTDRSDRPGSNEGLNDPVLAEAAREGAITRSDFSDGGGAEDPERSLLRTYVPLGTNAIVEIDQTDEGTVGPVRSAWFRYQLLAVGLLLCLLVMIALSLRDPIDRMNVGVPFAASSVPRGFSLIDDERLAAVHEVYRLASERVRRLQEKLGESEEARRRLEGDIQRVLSKAESSAPDLVAPAASAAPASTPSEPMVVHVPESDVVSASLDAWATAPAGPLARASRAQKPTPTTSHKEKPAAEKPKRLSKRIKAKPEKRTAAAPEVGAPPAPAPERRAAATAASPPAVPAAVRPAAATPPAVPAPVRPAASAPAPAPAPSKAAASARAPTPAPSKAAASAPAATTSPTPVPARIVPPKRVAAKPSDSESEDAKAHAAALETFIRLTESDRQRHETNTVDPGEIRAALARTAARKKPGGDRLQPHDGPHEESLGGPPKGRE